MHLFNVTNKVMLQAEVSLALGTVVILARVSTTSGGTEVPTEVVVEGKPLATLGAGAGSLVIVCLLQHMFPLMNSVFMAEQRPVRGEGELAVAPPTRKRLGALKRVCSGAEALARVSDFLRQRSMSSLSIFSNFCTSSLRLATYLSGMAAYRPSANVRRISTTALTFS